MCTSIRYSYDRRGRKGKEREDDRDQRREGGRVGGREGGERDGGGIGREGKDVYAESSSAQRATFIGAWMYDDDMLPLLRDKCLIL